MDVKSIYASQEYLCALSTTSLYVKRARCTAAYTSISFFEKANFINQGIKTTQSKARAGQQRHPTKPHKQTKRQQTEPSQHKANTPETQEKTTHMKSRLNRFHDIGKLLSEDEVQHISNLISTRDRRSFRKLLLSFGDERYHDQSNFMI